MTGLVCVLVLFLLESWVLNPAAFFEFLLLLSIGLFVDTLSNFLRYKRPICSVSAAVTVGLLQMFTMNVPLLWRVLACVVALVIGKHLWGGTGKNIFNPAVVGLLVISLFYNDAMVEFHPSFSLGLGILFAIPFCKFRPYAAAGMALGMVSALLLMTDFSGAGEVARETYFIWNAIKYGVPIWSCLIITDPTTSTLNPYVGAIGGLVIGFGSLYYYESLGVMSICLLSYNLVSYLVDKMSTKASVSKKLRMKEMVQFVGMNSYDKTDGLGSGKTLSVPSEAQAESLTVDEILKRIEINKVFGCGGAGFPTHEKIKSVIASNVTEKVLIVNAVECDPGLVHDQWIVRQYSETIEKATEYLSQCAEFNQIVVAAKSTEGVAFSEAIDLRTVKDYYPIGAEKILIKELLGKGISHDQITSQQGILVLNVQTLLSIYYAVAMNEAADRKYLTVADLDTMKGQVLNVQLGTGISDVIKSCYPHRAYAFRGGGLMNGQVIEEQGIIDEETNFLAVGALPRYKESPLCSRCGLCTIYCPSKLRVNELVDRYERNSVSLKVETEAKKCIQCGSCSYVCLAGKNLAAKIKCIKNIEHKNGLS